MTEKWIDRSKCAADKLVFFLLLVAHWRRATKSCNLNCYWSRAHCVWKKIVSFPLFLCWDRQKGRRNNCTNKIKTINYRKTQNSAENIQQSGGRATFNGCWTWRYGRQQPACANANHANKSANDHATFESCPSPSSSSPSSDSSAESVIRIAHTKFHGLTSGHCVRNTRRVGRHWALGSIPVEFASFISEHQRIGAFRSGITCSSHCRLSHRPISVGFRLALRDSLFCALWND